ncbi:ArnT family glycosyltransferase [Patescibacteria group bacterium]
MSKKTQILLIGIGILLRVIQLGQVPGSLNRDEVALGYNAYSIATEGIDEWGVRYPLMFKSFGDYKLPGYIYILTPLVKAFGLNEIIVRLPSLLAGISLIYLVYLLSQRVGLSKSKSLFASMLISISPWAIFYSRVGFEANVGLALFLASIYFLLKNSTKNTVLGVIFYFLSIATYNTPLLLLPLVLVVINIFNKNKKQKTIKSILVTIAALMWLVKISPLISQKSGITIFSDPTIIYEQSTNYTNAQNSFEKLRYNRYVDLGFVVSKNFLSSFSSRFLVTNGGANPWHSIPGKGHINWTLYVLASYSILKTLINRKSKENIFYLAIITIGLLPAIVTVDSPHATRSLIFFVGLVFVSAANMPKSKIIKSSIITLLFIETIIFSQRYFQGFEKNMSPTWQRGIKEKINEAKISYENQNKIIINSKAHPYIYVLFYQKVSPTEYVNSVKYYPKDNAGIELVKSFNTWQFIGDTKDAPENTPIIYQNQNGKFELISDKSELSR